MTPQEVVKKFMARLATHGFSNGTANLGTAMFDAAIQASSRFSSVDEVLSSMQADQLNAEQRAIQTVVTTLLGEEYFNTNCAGKKLSEIEETLNAATDLTLADVKDFVAGGYHNLADVIREVKSQLFLQDCCGIQLNSKIGFNSSGGISVFVSASGSSTGNDDTGALTGSDANISLKAGDTDFYGTILTDENLRALDANHQDGETLVLGTGTEKTSHSVVNEMLVNTYTASTNSAQIINTGTRNWVVQATAADDTITADGADSINAGAGDDSITVNGSGTTVTGGAGSDKIEISAQVNNVTITDFNAEDIMTINGSFEIGAAKIEDMLLVITDKMGTRKLKLGDFENSFDGTLNVNGASTTISQWLSDSGINLSDFTAANNSNESSAVKLDALNAANNSNESSAINLDDYVGADAGDIGTGILSSTFPATNIFTRNGLTVHLLGTSTTSSAANITACTYDQLTDAQKAIVAGLFKWWTADCLNLDEETYGISFNSDTATCKDIGLFFFNDTNSLALAAVGNSQRTNSDGFCTQLMLKVNMKYYGNVSDTDLDGVSSSALLDRTLAHEFVHALMASNVNFFNSLPEFITEGTAEAVCGIDDERISSIFRLGYDDAALTESLALTPGTGTVDAYSGGFMFMRYLAKQSALQTLLLPAYGDITATVDLSKFQLGDVLYCDNAGNVSTDDSGILLGKIIDDGTIPGYTGGDAIYVINDSGVKQLITTATNCAQVYGLTANTQLVAGTDDYDCAEIFEGGNLINTGGGENFIKVKGQYATVNAGDGNDQILVGEGSHHSLVAGDGGNYIRFEGDPLLANDRSYLYSFNYGNTILGGTNNDTLTNGQGLALFDDAGNTYHSSEVKKDENGVAISAGESGKYFVGDVEVTALRLYQFNYDLRADLGDGDNLVDLSYVFDGAIRTGGGADQFVISYLENSTLDSGAGDDFIETLGDNSKIYLGDGDDEIQISGQNISVDAGNGNDTIALGADVEKIFIANFAADDTLAFAEDVTATAYEDSALKVTAGEQQVTVDGLTAPTFTDNTWLSATTFGKAAGNDYVANGKQITYTRGNDEIYFTLSGLKDSVTVEQISAAVDVSGKTITFLDAAALDENKTVTVDGDYTLALGDLDTPKSVVAKYFDGTYTTAGKSAGYKLSDNTISYVDATTKSFEFTGIADDAKASNFWLSGKTLTIGKAAVKTDGTPVKILTEGYTLKLGKNMAAPKSLSAKYSDGTYTTSGKSAGYKLSDNTISYVDATTKSFEFTGIADGATASNFYLSGKTLTIGKAAVKTDGTPVKILTDGYTLKLGKNMAAPKSLDAKYSDNVYTTAGKSAGYKLSDNTISYVEATTKSFEFTGIADGATASNFYLSGKTLTIGKAAVKTDGTPVKILTDGYTLKLGKNMAAPKKNLTTLSGGVYSYTAQGAGYVLSDDSITYSAATSNVKLSGISSKPATPANNVLTLTADNFSDNVAIVSNGGYTFKLSGNLGGKTFTGSDGSEKISNAATNIKISAGDGNDSIQSTGGSSTLLGGAGKDTLAGSKKADILSGDDGSDILWGGSGNDSLSGGSGNDSLVGYTGNDTLWGGAGDDTLLGGAGNDTFIYRPNEGTDRILDFASNDLLKILNADGTQGSFSDSNFSGGKLTLNISGGGSVIFSNVSNSTTFNINGTTHTISGTKLK